MDQVRRKEEGMILELALIRHGKTFGNTQGRYIGTTDEPLCQEGIAALREKAAAYPAAELVFSSPMKRCVQTAEILYPDMKPYVLADFRECDFGAFENKNYEELSGNPAYQAWIDSGGTMAFPGGESREQVAERTVGAFWQMLKICRERQAECAALVVHGGTIMTIMEQFAVPKKNYYDWQVRNGCGFLTEIKINAKKKTETEAERAARAETSAETGTRTAAEIRTVTEVKEEHESITISVIAGISP